MSLLFHSRTLLPGAILTLLFTAAALLAAQIMKPHPGAAGLIPGE